MKYVKGFIAAYLYCVLLAALLYFRHFGMNEIVFALMLYAFFTIPLVLVGMLTVEMIIQANGWNKPMILFAGFLYGVCGAILFSGGVELELSILGSAGLFSSFGFVIYAYFRRERA